MIIVCQNCSSRLQVDDAKSPARPFCIRCPKCNNRIDSGPLNPSEKSALAVGGSPATEHHRFEPPTPAPPFQLEASSGEERGGSSDAERVVQLLASIMGQNGGRGRDTLNLLPSWSSRKALVCTPEGHRETVARRLAENGYQVFVAEDTRQAVERMRENQLDVVLLDPQFDPVEQGAAFVLREVNVLRPAQRRRLFFVLLSASLRTMDGHAAFLNNVNAIVNFNEVADLPRILDHVLRDYNELYKDFNSVLKMPAL